MNTIREGRLAKGYSQRKLARMLGVTQATISAWETGKQRPDSKHLQRLAELLEVSPENMIRLMVPRGEQERYSIAKSARELEEEFYQALAIMVSTMKPRVTDKTRIQEWVKKVVKLWSNEVFKQNRPPRPPGIRPFPEGTVLICNLCDLEVKPSKGRGCEECGLHCGWNPALDSGETGTP